MKNIFDIPLQKLFLVALILKVSSSFLGWFFKMPWSLGFTFPLIIMSTYIVLGYHRRVTDVADEKFADSCYYLGFIFTITSIIFCLFDLPDIGTRMEDIAVRFGAAMVSTVFGLGVRVYLISFKKDINDAIADVEDAILDATRKFSEQLTITVEKLQDFESKVDATAKSSVERVNLQIENLSKNHAEKLSEFFTELTTKNNKIFSQALNNVEKTTLKISDAIDNYSSGMSTNLTSVETKINIFAAAMTDRLKTTSFPDDYFAKRLESPLNNLTESADLLATRVNLVSTEVSRSAMDISDALKKLRVKAKATENSLDSVLNLTIQQQAVLDSAQGQLTTLGHLATNMLNFDKTLTNTLAGIAASNVVTTELTSQVLAIVTESTAARNSIEKSLLDFVNRLDSVAATSNINRIVACLDTNAQTSQTASALIASKIDGVVVADVQVADALGALGQEASLALEKFEKTMGQLQDMFRQFSATDSSLRAQSIELMKIVNSIKETKIIVDMEPPAAP
jgi:hypothetical protein